jgi:hypothetical protein
MQFYRDIGKHPIHIKKEVKGHVANRLQVALWREAVHLVAEGVVSVADADAAIAYGPGLRWALMGPASHISHGRRRRRHESISWIISAARFRAGWTISARHG